MSTKRHVQTMLRERSSQWVIPPTPYVPRPLVQIIGGQTSNSIPIIKYAATDPVLTKVYNPDTDTSYPDGMGNAWLIDTQGNHLRRVLVRHDFGGDTDYLMGASPSGGWTYEVRGTRSITVASGTDAGKSMTFYLIGWVR